MPNPLTAREVCDKQNELTGKAIAATQRALTPWERALNWEIFWFVAFLVLYAVTRYEVWTWQCQIN